MSDIWRVRATWSGFPGGPGVSTHYLQSVPLAADLTAIRTFYNALIAALPNTLSIQVLGSGDVVDDTNGQLTDAWSAAAPAVVVGTSASGYGAPVGTVVHWLTPSIVDGRRLKGTTFIVPTVNQFEPGGTPLASWVTTVTAAGTTLLGALTSDMMIWHRPKFGDKPGPGVPRPLLRPGTARVVTSCAVPDKAMVLRSRRD